MKMLNGSIMLAGVMLAPKSVLAAALSCASFATDPAAGLVDNPLITQITASIVPAGTPAEVMGPPPGPRTPGMPPVPAAPEVEHAAYCKVQFTYSSRSGTKAGYAPGQAQHIRIGIGLPLSNVDGGQGGKGGEVNGAWNGKLQNLGGGGCSGRLGSTTPATDAGYVGSTTDTGHTEQENGGSQPGEQRCNFGVIQESHELNKGMINDFIYESIHQQVEWAKTLSKAYYGTAASRNYWNGCSTGGRQGLAMAQEYGDEFDGFLIGAPAIYWQQFRLADAWPALVVKDRLVAKGKSLSAAQFAAAARAAVAACDIHGADLVKDGLIDDPRACTFSAKANICGAAGAPSSPDCLDADQAAAIDVIWDGPRNEQGAQIWHPFDRGIALSENSLFGGGSISGSTAQVLSYNHRDVSFPTNNLYVDKAAVAAAGNPPNAITYEAEAVLGSKQVADLMDTQQVNLSKVKNRGGKIMMWHGTGDPAIRWRHSADYYRRVATYFGKGKADFDGLRSWFRYYPAPGVGHCGGGDGPAPVAIFDEMVKWVESGVAPDSVPAKGGAINPERTRPLCAWPQTAIYNGSGSIDDAKNFSCGGNRDENPTAVCKMLHTQYKKEDRKATDAKEKGLGLQCK